MHEIQKKQVSKYFLYEYNTLIRTYASLEAFLESPIVGKRRWVTNYLSDQEVRPEKVWGWPRGWYDATPKRYTLRDADNNILTADYLLNFLPKESKGYWGSSGKKYGNYHDRRPKLGQTRRDWDVVDEDELEYKVKRRRKDREAIFDPWYDGYRRSRRGNKNWKEYRRHQWKEKPKKKEKLVYDSFHRGWQLVDEDWERDNQWWMYELEDWLRY